MGASDLRVSVAVAKLRCVMEPALALSHPLGLQLALGLAGTFEVWLTRSFWRVLDASELLPHGPLRTVAHASHRLANAHALAEWAALRDTTDAGSWQMRWVGDSVAESQLPARDDADLVERFEWLAAALDASCDNEQGGSAWWPPLDLRAGVGDTLALSAALGGALILCASAEGDEAPAPVQVLQHRRVPTVRMADDEVANLLVTERQLVRHRMASAGVAVLLQSLPPLAVVHVLVDARPSSASADESDSWASAQAWWYPL